jgi:hypothetical protein
MSSTISFSAPFNWLFYKRFHHETCDKFLPTSTLQPSRFVTTVACINYDDSHYIIWPVLNCSFLRPFFSPNILLGKYLQFRLHP